VRSVGTPVVYELLIFVLIVAIVAAIVGWPDA
jgi:hypothetical protein